MLKMRQGDQIIGVWFCLIAFHKLLKRVNETGQIELVFYFKHMNRVLPCLENLTLCYKGQGPLSLVGVISWPRIPSVYPVHMCQPKEWFWVHKHETRVSQYIKLWFTLCCKCVIYYFSRTIFIINKYPWSIHSAKGTGYVLGKRREAKKGIR